MAEYALAIQRTAESTLKQEFFGVEVVAQQISVDIPLIGRQTQALSTQVTYKARRGPISVRWTPKQELVATVSFTATLQSVEALGLAFAPRFSGTVRIVATGDLSGQFHVDKTLTVEAAPGSNYAHEIGMRYLNQHVTDAAATKFLAEIKH